MYWKNTASTKIQDAIAALRDVASNRKQLQEEQATLEERIAFVTNELGRIEQQYSDAKKVLVAAVVEG
jgi:hypothetical protein